MRIRIICCPRKGVKQTTNINVKKEHLSRSLESIFIENGIITEYHDKKLESHKVHFKDSLAFYFKKQIINIKENSYSSFSSTGILHLLMIKNYEKPITCCLDLAGPEPVDPEIFIDVDELRIAEYYYQLPDLSKCSIKKIVIDCSGYKYFFKNLPKDIEELELIDFTSPFFDLSKFEKLHTLKFSSNKTYYDILDAEMFPPNLEKLHLPFLFGEMPNLSKLPIKVLFLGDRVNFSLSSDRIPSTLEELHLAKHGKRQNLPDLTHTNLTILDLGDDYVGSIVGKLPPSIKVLHMSPTASFHTWDFTQFKNLQKLYTYYVCDEIIMPLSVRDLTIDFTINTDFPNLSKYCNIGTLQIKGEFNSGIPSRKLPRNVCKLSILGKYNRALFSLQGLKKLKEMRLGNCFTHRLDSKTRSKLSKIELGDDHPQKKIIRNDHHINT